MSFIIFQVTLRKWNGAPKSDALSEACLGKGVNSEDMFKFL